MPRITVVTDARVKVTVPQGFTLTDDLGRSHSYGPGSYSMLEGHAKHWYAQAAGVAIVSDEVSTVENTSDESTTTDPSASETSKEAGQDAGQDTGAASPVEP